jgi:LCP family protein required for cell wall assembly
MSIDPQHEATSQSENEPASNHGRAGRRIRALLGLTAAASLIIALVGGLGFGSLVWAQRQLDSTSVVSQPDPENPGQKIIGGPCVRHACNYLLLGSDSRTGLSHQDQVISGTNADLGGTQRSDTIILIHVDPNHEKATILSFPRDLWVPIPGQGTDKINSAFEGGVHGGGPDRVARTVENLTGLHINHFLYVDLAGFQGVVDALGGVRMCVPYPMQDPLTGLNIRAGCQDFDGRTALAFVRTRHQPCDVVPDFARIGRQQQFLRAVLTKLLSPSEVTNLPGLVKPVAQNIVKDSDFKILDIVELARELRGVSTGAADFRAVPGVPKLIRTPAFPSGISVVTLSPQARQIFRDLRSGRPLGDLGKSLEQTPISEANIEVTVYDKASNGHAQEVEKVLAEGGFNVAPGVASSTQYTGKRVKGSAILYGPGDQAQADVVKQYFPNVDEVQVDRAALDGGAVGVYVTSGYRAAPVGGGAPTPNCGAGVVQSAP